LFETGQQVQGERSQKFNTLTRFLTRGIDFPGGITVTALYASEDYFAYADRSGAVEAYRPDKNHVFFINEESHVGELPLGLPDAYLEINGLKVPAKSVEGPEWAEHHRTTIVSFSKLDQNGDELVSDLEQKLTLKLIQPWDRYRYENDELVPVESTYIWDLPLNIPEKLKSRDTFTNAMVFSLSAGLLASVLTPCLLQLVVIFFATLGGMSAKEVVESHTITPELRARVLMAASCFVAGYVVLFVASGAIIGYVGKEAQLFFANYSRSVGVGAGVVVILFGLWLGIRSNTPIVCKLPGAQLIQKRKGKGMLGTVLVSLAFSLGCMSCFGGAIIGTLFIYVGALGSPLAGAYVMGIFAAGVAVPFLLSAIFFSKMQGVFEAVLRHTRTVGAVSTIVIVGFGVMLITDNFHTVSDFIYPYLGLD